MKSVLLIGVGRFGRNTAIKLKELHHQVMAVDKDEKRISEIMPYVTDARIGDSTDEGFLQSLGIRNYDLCYVCIGDSFQDSLETTSFLKEAGARMVVARASSEVHAKFLGRNGADAVVYPEQQVAEWAAIRYSADHIFDYIAMGCGYGIFEIAAPERWIGRTIGELDIRKHWQINILATKSEGTINMNIGPDTVLTANETLLVLGRNEEMKKCFKI